MNLKNNYDKTEGAALFDDLIQNNYNFFTGLPCSYFKEFFKKLNKTTLPHVRVPLESQAVGVAAGAYLAGMKPVVYAQNSAIGYLINPITSLLIPNNIDIMFVISHRVKPYQHKIMGEIDKELFSLINWPEDRVIWIGDSNA